MGKMKGLVTVITGIVASGSVSGAPQNFIMNRCTNDCNIRDLSNIQHNQVSTNYVDYRNENTYNLDNIFTNVRSTSTSSNDYFNVLPYFSGNRRFKREALSEELAPYAYQTKVQNPDHGMEYQVDVTVDRNGNSRSFQRVQQNEVEIRDPSQRYQILERSMPQGLNGNRRLQLEQYRADISSAEERSMLEQRQMRERERMDNRRMMEQRFMDQRNMDDQTNMDQIRMDQRNDLDQELLDRRHMRNEQMMDSRNLKEQIYLEQMEKVGQDQIDQKRAMLDRVEDQERRLMEQQQMGEINYGLMEDRGEQMLRMDQGQVNRMEEQRRMEGSRMSAQKQMANRMYMRNPMVNRRMNHMA